MGSKGVYAGSFDPITRGHVWMIEQGSRLFESLIVAIGINPDKQYTFTLEDRLAMLRETLRPLKNVVVDTFENQFLVTYAASVGARYVLRGIRSQEDYEYERAMRHVNSDLSAEVSTVFLMPPREIAEISSSLVKGLVGLKGWEKVVRKYVPEAVFRRLKTPR